MEFYAAAAQVAATVLEGRALDCWRWTFRAAEERLRPRLLRGVTPTHPTRVQSGIRTCTHPALPTFFVRALNLAPFHPQPLNS